MSPAVELLRITPDNVDEHGFFCKKSKRKSDGWKAKRTWFETAAGDGLQLWIAQQGKRQVGFIELAPGASTWRVIDAPDHMVVQCVWVVGRAKSQGTGQLLWKAAADHAASQGKGMAVLTSTKKGWLLGSQLVDAAGLQRIDTAPPCFELWATTPAGARPPRMPSDWADRAAAFGAGLTLVYGEQCPYVDSMRQVYAKAAADRGFVYREVRLESAADARQRAPSAYGVFSVVKDGKLATWRYEGDSVLDRLLG